MAMSENTTNDVLLVLVTAPSHECAKSMAHTLVEERLAACVNIVPEIQSVFFWENKIQESKEVLMLIKTTKNLFSKLETKILAIHDYTCPEIIAFPVHYGLEKYCNWVKETLFN